MMFIGMITHAQTIDNPIKVNGDSLILNAWVYKDYDTNKKVFFTNNRYNALDISMGIMYKAYGRTEWPEVKDLYSDGVRTTEWILPDNSFIQLIKNESKNVYFVVIYK